MKYVFVSILCALIVVATSAGATTLRTADRIFPTISGHEARIGSGVRGALPSSSPGDTMGWSYYDYQHNGSIGKMINHVGDGNLIFSWMCATEVSLANRHVYYNYWKADSGFRWPGNPSPGGVQVDQQLKSGYTTCDVLSDGRAVIAFHERVDPNPNAYYTAVAVELAAGLGVFDVTAVDTFTWAPTNIDSCPIWPHIAVDMNDNIHVTAMNNATAGFQWIDYSRSTDQGWTWEPWFTMDTSLMDVAYMTQTSRVSGKVGIAYPAFREGMNPDYISQMSNDIYYWESNNGGATWDLQRYNLTQWAEDDTLRCYDDVDLIYDNDDNAHFVFTVYKAEGDSAYYPYYSMILHSDIDGNRNRVSGWGWPPDSMNGWWFTTVDPGGWRFPADRPNLGLDDDNNLKCIWVGCRDEDISAGGYHNGDIYTAASDAALGPGTEWGVDGDQADSVWNLTMSESPGAIPGECDDDDYPSLAEHVYNGFLHIIYVNDKDAGGIPQEEGTATDNPIIYLSHEAPRYGGIAEGPQIPDGPVDALGLTSYPNPVSSRCEVSFSIPSPCRARVVVYDACGRLVKSLVDNEVEVGDHSVEWDGRDASGAHVGAGVYFCRLTAGSASTSHKMVMMR